MSADHDAEKELIALSKDQRLFFEKLMPGMKLYPYQEELISAILNGKVTRKLIMHRRPIGKTPMMRAVEKYLEEHPNADKQ